MLLSEAKEKAQKAWEEYLEEFGYEPSSSKQDFMNGVQAGLKIAGVTIDVDI